MPSQDTKYLIGFFIFNIIHSLFSILINDMSVLLIMEGAFSTKENMLIKQNMQGTGKIYMLM